MMIETPGILSKVIEQYWLDKLTGIDDAAGISGSGADAIPGLITATIDADAVTRVNRLARNDGVSEFAIYLAVLGLMLRKYFNEESVVIASPQLQSVPVPQSNDRPVFHRLSAGSGDMPLKEFIRASLTEVQETSKYYNFDYRRLKTQFVNRNISEAALYQYAFSYTAVNADSGNMDHAALMLHLEKLPHGPIQATLRYDTERYGEQVAHFLSHYIRLVEKIEGILDSAIAQIDFLTEQEKKNLLYDFNASDLQYDSEKTLVELFEEQAALTPQAVALYYEGTALRYVELNEVSNQLAHYLRIQHNIGPDSVVAFMLDKSEMPVVAILAILKAGAAYVPIDPAYPAARIAYILDNTEVKVLLTQSDYLMQLGGYAGAVFAMDIELPTLEDGVDNLGRINTPVDLAYVIYTSGSTGNPKGVMISHGAVVNLVAGLEDIIYKNQHAPLKIALIASLVFDPSVQQIFAALLKGHALYIIPDDVKKSGDKLWRYYHRHGIHVTDGTPALLTTLVSGGREQAERLALTHFIIGGDVLPKLLVKQFYELLGEVYSSIRVVNIYGPTEACVDITAFTIHPGDVEKWPSIPIGKPMANRRLYILNRDGQPQPVGIYGEIWVGGAGLARGYLHQDDLTARKFVANPFEPAGGGLYRTGDRGRWLANGVIEFSRRLDEQLKIRGYRIEPAEVELALRKHPAVREAVAVAHASNGSITLAAYFVSTEPVPTASLRAFLQNLLPDYMIPVYLVALPRLPLTINGKVDKKLLPQPQQSQLQDDWQAPRTPQEELLVSLWQQVLDRERVGTNDNFFLLGGDSIKAIQVASRMHAAGYSLEVKDIFQHSTIRELAQVVMTQKVHHDESAVIGPVPLTPIQHAFFDQHFAEPQHYNQTVLLEFSSRIEETTLRAVFDKLLIHHDALRMRYQRIEGKVRQYNTAPGEPAWLEFHELPELTRLQERVNQVQSSLDLEHGPLLKVVLFRLPHADYVMVVIHHLVVDGISWRILLEDLSGLMSQIAQGQPLSLPPKSSAYRQWALALEEMANSHAMTLQRHYWEKVEQQVLAQNRSVGVSAQTGDAGEINFQLTSHQTAQLLRQVPAAFHTEINDVLLAGLSRAFCRVLAWQNLVVALEGHGREFVKEDVDIGRTVGWFTSIYPVVLHGGEQRQLGRHLQETKEYLRGVPNKGIGYGILKYLSDKGREAETLPVDVCFNYLGQVDSDTTTSHFRIAPESAGQSISLDNKSQYKMIVTGWVIQARLQIRITYDSGSHTPQTMAQVCAAYEQALLEIIDFCCQQSVSQKTPSDFTFKELTLDELDSMFE